MTIFGLHVLPLGLGCVALGVFAARYKLLPRRIATFCLTALIGLGTVGAGIWQERAVDSREADARYLLQILNIQVVRFAGIYDMDVTVRKDGCEATFTYQIGLVDERPMYPLVGTSERDVHGRNCVRLNEIFFVPPPW